MARERSPDGAVVALTDWELLAIVVTREAVIAKFLINSTNLNWIDPIEICRHASWGRAAKSGAYSTTHHAQKTTTIALDANGCCEPISHFD